MILFQCQNRRKGKALIVLEMLGQIACRIFHRDMFPIFVKVHVDFKFCMPEWGSITPSTRLGLYLQLHPDVGPFQGSGASKKEPCPLMLLSESASPHRYTA